MKRERIAGGHEGHGKEVDFPGRISRRLSLLLGIVLVVVLLVGGVSILLARSIFVSTGDIEMQAQHIETIDAVHAAVHHLISAIQQSEITGVPTLEGEQQNLTGDLRALMAQYAELEATIDTDHPDQESEMKIFLDIGQMITGLLTLSEKLFKAVALGQAVDRRDLDHLTTVSTRIPNMTHEMNEIHRMNIDRSIGKSRERLWVILGFYLAFIMIGSVLIFGSSIVFHKSIVLPVRQLASATQEVASGDFRKRVSVTSQDEIGQLAHSFNVMAERLAEDERQLKATHKQLERKAQETEALYQIGMEISSLLPVDQVIEQVVSHGRQLLQADRAGLALLEEASQEIHWKIFLGGEEEAFKKIRLKPGQGVAGRVISRGKPMIIEDVSKDPADAPEANPILKLEHLHSALAVPIRWGDQVVGALMVGNLIPSQFGDDQVRLLTGLASQAAVAIENARLYEQTGALATVRERERIARDMHDGLAQALGYIHMHLGALEARISAEAQGEIRGELREIKKVAGEAYEEIRQSIFGLRTMVSRGLGFIPTLTEYLHEFSRKNGITTYLQVGGDHAPRFSPDVEVQLVRIIQEALANIRKHAGGRRAVVRFDVEGNRCCVTVSDDGQGFEPGKVPKEGSHHFGLQAMRERAEGIGGTLEIDTAPGKGTKVMVRVPL
jgi:nitrate/nitrite-specific signal transduction histidine kinase